MMAATYEQLRSAAELLAQPLLLEILEATESRRSPREAAPPEADPAILRAAIDRLTAFGAVQTVDDDWNQPLTLTARGQKLMQLLHELDAHQTLDRHDTPAS
jgi:hypothetical protein